MTFQRLYADMHNLSKMEQVTRFFVPFSNQAQLSPSKSPPDMHSEGDYVVFPCEKQNSESGRLLRSAVESISGY